MFPAVALLFIILRGTGAQLSTLCSVAAEQHCNNVYNEQVKLPGSDCSSNGECIAPSLCVSFVCRCPPSHMADALKMCVPLPQWRQPCVDGTCASPYLCSSRSLCDECPKHMLSTEKGCQLHCGDGEVEGSTQCIPIVTHLNGACTESVQCRQPYTSCRGGVCRCIEGTSTNMDTSGCEAKAHCPSGGTPHSVNGGVTACRPMLCPFTKSDSSIVYDDCPSGFSCHYTSWQVANGVCCPGERPWCPNGVPLDNSKCGNAVVHEDERCPLATHECFRGQFGAEYCCPKPCPNIPASHTAVIVAGECHVRRSLGEPCQLKEQCPLNAQCSDAYITPNAARSTTTTIRPPPPPTCRCMSTHVQRISPVGQQVCVLRCQPNEVSLNAACHLTVLPLGICEYNEQCVVGGTVCRGGVCKCPCHMGMLNGHCIDVPICPGGVDGVSMSPLGSGSALFSCYPATSLFTVNTCTNVGGYCMPLSTGGSPAMGGVCCPLPSPRCIHSATPHMFDGKPIKCNVMLPNCDNGYYCHDYVQAATGASITTGVTRGICCPGNARNPISIKHLLFVPPPR